MAKTKQDKEIEAKQKARESAKVRKDKPVADERIYYNMPKKKTTAAKKTTKKATTKKTSKQELTCTKEQKVMLTAVKLSPKG